MNPAAAASHALGKPGKPPKAEVELNIDGKNVRVPDDYTILGAARSIGLNLPTLCYLETLRPVNVCRICVVELQGARVLVPSCSRRVEPGMVVKTASERVQLARKLVLEMLASSVDLSTAPGMNELLSRYGCDAGRFGPLEGASRDQESRSRAGPHHEGAHDEHHGARDAAVAGHHAPPDLNHAATVAQPAKIDNDLYVRDYGKCVLCYKCVEACGPDHQNTFAIAVAGRGFAARISTEFATPLPNSACVYCGNCIAVCPTGALMAKREYDLRAAHAWNESVQSRTDTICPYCGVGCTLTLHTQGGEIVKATSPLDNEITSGNLCIKGRFGWQFVGQGVAAKGVAAMPTAQRMDAAGGVGASPAPKRKRD